MCDQRVVDESPAAIERLQSDDLRVQDKEVAPKRLCDYDRGVFLAIVGSARFSQMDRLSQTMPKYFLKNEIWKYFYKRIGFDYTHFPWLSNGDQESWRTRSMIISGGATRCPKCKFDVGQEYGNFYWNENGRCLYCLKDSDEKLASLRCEDGHLWDAKASFVPFVPGTTEEVKRPVVRCLECCVIAYAEQKKTTDDDDEDDCVPEDSSGEEDEDEDGEEEDLSYLDSEEKDVVCHACKSQPCACKRSCRYCRAKPCECDWCEEHDIRRIGDDYCPKCRTIDVDAPRKRRRVNSDQLQ